MLSGRLISQITTKNDIISILYTKETLRNRGRVRVLQSENEECHGGSSSWHLSWLFVSQTNIKQIRVDWRWWYIVHTRLL